MMSAVHGHRVAQFTIFRLPSSSQKKPGLPRVVVSLRNRGAGLALGMLVVAPPGPGAADSPSSSIGGQ